MQGQSLNQIMNDMVARLDVLRPDDPSQRSPQPLSELEAFMQMDTLLANLNKQYLEAKQQRKELVALNGADDAMAEVAMDMEDSAWCAMQTRYLELRQERELMEKAQRLMREAEEAVEAEIKRDKEKEFNNYVYWTKTLQRIREKNKTPKIFEWAFLMLIFKIEPFGNHRPSFNRLAMAA
ncbi:MAG TPA: hypothetical protein PLF01_02720 [Alphaproteobacteria bacterium]|nr:hypothetical protein [Alphaproteobacteria bacterium]